MDLQCEMLAHLVLTQKQTLLSYKATIYMLATFMSLLDVCLLFILIPIPSQQLNLAFNTNNIEILVLWVLNKPPA